MKRCCTCKELKNVSLFYKNKNTTDKLAGQCKECAKKYRQEHKAKVITYPSSSKEQRILYRLSHSDYINELRRRRRAADPEKYRLKERKRYLKNKDKIRSSQRTFYNNNKEYFKSKNAKYRNENKEYILLKNRKRKKLLSGSNISQKDVNNLLLKHNNKCFYCKIEIKQGINLHLDHGIPLCRGGFHTIDNIFPACSTCNLRKGTKTNKEFMDIMEKM